MDCFRAIGWLTLAPIPVTLHSNRGHQTTRPTLTQSMLLLRLEHCLTASLRA